MNALDIIIGGILAVSVIYGVYHGFLHTVFSIGGALLSGFLAFAFGPRAADWLRALPGVKATLTTYTDAIARVGDFDLANTQVRGLTGDVIDTVLRSVSLPEPLAKLLKDNLSTQAFAQTNANTVNDYVSKTIVSTAVDVLCFLLVFALSYMVISFILGLISHVVDFPILRQLDWLAGAALGLLRGGLIVYLLLLLLPILQTVVPDQGLASLISTSKLLPLFNNVTLFLKVAAVK